MRHILFTLPLLQVPGLVNVDFADVRAVMQGAGSSLMGQGRASGAEGLLLLAAGRAGRSLWLCAQRVVPFAPVPPTCPALSVCYTMHALNCAARPPAPLPAPCAGKTRARDAALAAISSPLLEMGIDRATGIVWNITGPSDMTLYEVRVFGAFQGVESGEEGRWFGGS